MIAVEKIKITQVHLLQQIAKQAFFETFANTNSKVDMAEYLTNRLSLEQLTLELNNQQSQFYIIKLDQEYAGYLKLNWGNAQNEFQEDNGLEIERLYVLKQYHRQKVGQALYDHAISIARQKKVDYVWLGVWENNERAISFYQRNGLQAFSQHVFELGTDKQTDILMKYILK